MTDQEIAALQAKITDAETKYHNLLTGSMPRVVVDQNGERVEFVSANRGQLLAYINQLKSLLPSGLPNTIFSRPIGFIF